MGTDFGARKIISPQSKRECHCAFECELCEDEFQQPKQYTNNLKPDSIFGPNMPGLWQENHLEAQGNATNIASPLVDQSRNRNIGIIAATESIDKAQYSYHLLAEHEVMATNSPGQQQKPIGLYDLPTQCVPFAPYVEKDTHYPLESTTVDLDRRGIDINILRNWIQLCSSKHGNRCKRYHQNTSDALGKSRPLYLIDTGNMNIIRADQHSYVALSYVWAQNEEAPEITTTQLINDKNASSMIPNAGVTPVIKDAVKLVRQLGQRYLWVDRFCIPQKEGVHKQSQLDAMGKIYEGAWLTIFAAQDTDTNRGLYASRSVVDIASLEKDSQLTTSDMIKVSTHGFASLNNEQVILRNSRVLMASRWASRGWTFQEHLFSSRRIIFQDNTVGWECQSSSWHETQDLSKLINSNDASIPKRIGSSEEMMDSWWPNMYRYARLVTLYNRRRLSYPEDALDAFRGALTMIGRPYQGSFISGLPEIFFDATLLWQPWFPLQKRRPVRAGSGDALLPSWSWIGWSGELCSDNFATAYSYMRPIIGRGIREWEPLPWLTISTVNWHYSETLTSEHKSINYKAYSRNTALTQHQHDVNHLDWEFDQSKQDDQFYRHKRNLLTTFWYPIPIRNSPQIAISLVKARFIHGQTRTAMFSLGKTFISKASNCAAVDLLDSLNNEWAGCLRLNHHWSINKISLRAKHCQLIEISAGCLKGGSYGEKLFDEWLRIKENYPNEDYGFYNVLCVSWKVIDGHRVAYRRALGRVVKVKWDAIAYPIDITLG